MFGQKICVAGVPGQEPPRLKGPVSPEMFEQAARSGKAHWQLLPTLLCSLLVNGLAGCMAGLPLEVLMDSF